MPANPSNPHDAYFRRVLSRPADAACELRAALPAAVTDRIDWDTLRLQSGSFVSADLRSRYSDLLYRIRLDGHTAYIYLLIEHQSRSDHFMALRILEYLVGIWNQHRSQHPEARTLPAVIPLVVHSNHTGRPWKAPTEVADLIDLDPSAREALQPHLPRLRFLLDDVAALDLPALLRRDLTPATRVMLALHKMAPNNIDLGTDIISLIDDLRALLFGPEGKSQFQAVIAYMMTVSDISEVDLLPLVDQLGPPAKEAIVTTAERLRAEGEARGEARGRAEGEARGRAEALIEQLTVKFGPLPTHIIDTVHAGTPEQVRTWSARILTATTLDEIFA
ncbi:Rpn family recombination-promoting nuclease/putative transposase [Nocardia kruczakiae]|uniref:Rpn family recombination-promoting nuclease/putative transposase n=1 Tax=Nocardia kruczakiae TaxID=261477 RepID=UPI00286A0E38|nr:Rpn family recombination-promoting nuclease/putative transposase [Nocardia kruczakiae]